MPRSRALTAAALAVILSGVAAPALTGVLDRMADEPPLEISGQTLDGQDWRLADQRGRVVLVSFWAGWCPPCLQEVPSLNRLAERLRDRPFSLVGINVGEVEMRARTLVNRLRIGFPVLLDPEEAFFQRWGAQILPTAYILDTEGHRRWVAQGPMEWEDTETLAAIEGLLPPSPGEPQANAN